jgi:hypothetical protein
MPCLPETPNSTAKQCACCKRDTSRGHWEQRRNIYSRKSEASCRKGCLLSQFIPCGAIHTRTREKADSEVKCSVWTLGSHCLSQYLKSPLQLKHLFPHLQNGDLVLIYLCIYLFIWLVVCFQIESCAFAQASCVNYNPPTSVSLLTGITSVWHPTWLVLWDRESLTFCLSWPQSMTLPVPPE